MKEFIEKLISRLEEEVNYNDGADTGVAQMMKVVNELAEEYEHCIKSSCSNCEVYDNEKHYCPKWCDVIKGTVAEIEENNNGWIPCSEKYPEIDGNTSDTVLVCGSNGFQYMAFWCDDLQWRFCECGMAKEPVLWTEIIAWQPLPAPYQPKGEQTWQEVSEI